MKRMCIPFHAGFLASHGDDATSTSCLHTQLVPSSASLQKSQIKVEVLIVFVAHTEVFLIILEFIKQHTMAHGLRNEMTTLHESASAGVLFTPLVWWH
jgi:hypothetical protein